MALLPLNLCQDLQPWHDAGVYYLLFADIENTAALLGAPAPTAKSTPRPVKPGSPDTGFGTRGPTVETVQRVMPNEGAAPVVSPPPVMPELADESLLPAPWQALLHKVQPAPVGWSYLELGEDLLLQGDKQRSATLKKLIGGLQLGAGTNTFLPTVLPGLSAEEAARGQAAFGFSLKKLGCKILIFLGKNSFAQSPYAHLNLSFFQEQVADGKLILCLPDIKTLGEDAAKLDATIIYLRSALAKIKIIGG